VRGALYGVALYGTGRKVADTRHKIMRLAKWDKYVIRGGKTSARA